jgi:hypothetical protein
MAEIFDTVLEFFQQDDWPFAQIEEQTALQTGFRGEHGQFNCLAQVLEEESLFLFYSLCPVNVPEDRRMSVAEFLARANYGLYIGNFELDFDDGEVRFKTSVDVEEGHLSPGLIKNLVYTNVLMTDRYLPGIMRVIYGDTTPAEAVAEIED